MIKQVKFNVDLGHSQKAANESTKGIGGREVSGQTTKKTEIVLSTKFHLQLQYNYPMETVSLSFQLH